MKKIVVLFLYYFFISFLCLANDIKPLEEFDINDRILIFAPHPDDETLATAGIIQRAIKSKAKIRIVLYTNGDNNELAFIVYNKRPVFKKKEFINMGLRRRKESIKAMNFLGLKSFSITTLGYPDFGTLEIFTKYWDTKKPYKSMFPRLNRVSYRGSLSFGAPYVGESILDDLKNIILDFKPTKIFVSHPNDTNPDHRSLFLFLQVALWDLKEKIKKPEVFCYLIHYINWPKPRGYHLNLKLTPPCDLNLDNYSWYELNLNSKEIEKKYKALSFYKTQTSSHFGYLLTFIKTNELFMRYFPIKVKKEINGDNSISSLDKNKDNISHLSYTMDDENLFIKLTLKRKIDKNFGISIFLFGYNKNIDFSKMPKFYFHIGLGGLRVKEKKQTLFIKDINLVSKGKNLVIKIPLSILKYPDYILSCVRTRFRSLPFNEMGWQILELNS